MNVIYFEQKCFFRCKLVYGSFINSEIIYLPYCVSVNESLRNHMCYDSHSARTEPSKQALTSGLSHLKFCVKEESNLHSPIVTYHLQLLIMHEIGHQIFG